MFTIANHMIFISTFIWNFHTWQAAGKYSIMLVKIYKDTLNCNAALCGLQDVGVPLGTLITA